MNKLEQLKTMTEVVADTGEIEAIRSFKPQDATTNPSLLLKAVALPEYVALVADAKRWAKTQAGTPSEQMSNLCDKLAVDIGSQILKVIPGRVSSEVDARLSFDTEATLNKARRLIELYAENDIAPERVLIKIASTWEGIRAASVLEREGINCNLTLLFSFAQAAACAQAGVFLISPFVGRILDWYKNSTGETYDAETDPGVVSVRRIYDYYKAHNYQTVVMGASFRNIGEIEALAGCDRLTISPPLLAELSQDSGELVRRLQPSGGGNPADAKTELSEIEYRWAMNEDAMATEKLAEGIRNFAADQVKLEVLMAD
ncbi:MAG: transaldolase [Limisphaerales bacterium]|jgi:transaldolase